ncbi:uncharacterized protein METZ01_LOCUS261537, partial [marine metagenome]
MNPHRRPDFDFFGFPRINSAQYSRHAITLFQVYKGCHKRGFFRPPTESTILDSKRMDSSFTA